MPKLEDLDPRLQAAIKTVTGKRPLRVIQHILEHGIVTTEDLAKMGYNHAPRAARDVRECGVPLTTTRVAATDGKSIGAYTFGDPSSVENHKLGGRQVLPKELRDRLLAAQGGRCAVCSQIHDRRYFQVDHRVPYEIAGDSSDPANTQDFLALCATCQRRKSWSCEHCANWGLRNVSTCRTCIWADPLNYKHIATEDARSLTLVFAGSDAALYDQVRTRVGAANLPTAARRAVLALGGPNTGS
jgi:hypothetical protein